MHDEQHGVASVGAADRDPLLDTTNIDEHALVDSVRRGNRERPFTFVLTPNTIAAQDNRSDHDEGHDTEQ